MKLICLSGCALALSACAAAPKVQHSIIRSSAALKPNQIATYALQENLVTFKATTTGEGDKKKTTVGGEVDRQDHEGLRIAISQKKRIGINTDVTIKKFENTDIPSEVTVKVEDTRADLVKKTGELIVGVVKSGLVPFSLTGDAKLPARINLTAKIESQNPNQFVVQTDENIEIIYGPIPPDAVPTEDQYLVGGDSYFYYAACRTAGISFNYRTDPKSEKSDKFAFTYKVADPHYLQRVRMPVDGKIVMHSQCGASVTGKMTGDDAASALAITSALVAQGQSIKDAIKAAKEKEEKGE